RNNGARPRRPRRRRGPRSEHPIDHKAGGGARRRHRARRLRRRPWRTDRVDAGGAQHDAADPHHGSRAEALSAIPLRRRGRDRSVLAQEACRRLRAVAGLAPQRAGAGHEAGARNSRELSARTDPDGWPYPQYAFQRRVAAGRQRGLPGDGRQPCRAEPWSNHEYQGKRGRTDRTGAGRSRRLDEAGIVAPASGDSTMKVMPGAWRRVGFAAVCRGMFASVGVAGVVATVVMVAPQVARADSNSIESVTSSRQGDATYLRITMAKPPANPPAGFTISNPPRIALDFADTANDSGRSSYELSQGDVRKVNIVTASNRSRLVLSLKRQVGYKTEIEGRDVLITLEPIPTAAVTAAKPASYTFAKPEPQIGKVVHALRDIDFRRGKDGAGRVLVELSDSNVGVDIRQQGQTIVVDFQNAQLPDNLVRRLDVGD